MRIGIDIRYLSHNLVGGVHTYVKNLVPALLSEGKDHQFFLYADNKSQLELAEIPANASVRFLPWQNGFYSIYHDLINLRSVMAKDSLDIAHFPANYGFSPKNVKTVITLHDQINIMPWLEIIRGNPKNMRTFVMMTYLHICSSQAVRKSDSIITISEYAKQQIHHYARTIKADQITVIHSGIEQGLKQITDPLELNQVRDQLEKPFVLADALKNPAVIVRAWQHLPEDLRSKYQIVFFSRHPNPLPVVFDAVDAGIAKLLVRPPRNDLIALFSQASIFVFPSWVEGFGLPLLEAMACGAPVIASDRGSIPEVAGEAALIVDAEDDIGLADNISTLLTSPDKAAEMRLLGFKRAAQFNWDRTAQAVLDHYQQLSGSIATK